MTIVERKCLVYSEKSENSNKFYIMELQENNGAYILITRYGRFGRTPTIKKKAVSSEYVGLSEISNTVFKKKNHNKTPYQETTIDDILSNGDSWWNE